MTSKIPGEQLYRIPVGVQVWRVPLHDVVKGLLGGDARWCPPPALFVTTKEVVYTDADLIDIIEVGWDNRTYFVFRLPASSGYSRIEVEQKFVERLTS